MTLLNETSLALLSLAIILQAYTLVRLFQEKGSKRQLLLYKTILVFSCLVSVVQLVVAGLLYYEMVTSVMQWRSIVGVGVHFIIFGLVWADTYILGLVGELFSPWLTKNRVFLIWLVCAAVFIGGCGLDTYLSIKKAARVLGKEEYNNWRQVNSLLVGLFSSFSIIYDLVQSVYLAYSFHSVSKRKSRNGSGLGKDRILHYVLLMITLGFSLDLISLGFYAFSQLGSNQIEAVASDTTTLAILGI